ncbi:MAG: phage tail sheath subtilisin-like domain-containing protein [Rhodospirillales bacterium]|nr:phage tail sheath subtilisin-like domain-containing protein [Rhodospirillales bacterium]
MPANFLHGIEVTEVTTGPVPVTVVNSAVIGLVGSAPQWAAASGAPVPPNPDTPTLSGSTLADSQFGPLVRGYTIPRALNAIRAQGSGQVIVVNVFNPAVHQTVVAATAFSMPASGTQVVNLKQMGLIGPGLPNSGTLASTVVVQNSGKTTTYIENTDYTVDYVNGFVYAKTGGAITLGEALSIAYTYADPSKVMDADIVGAVTGGVYTGMQAFLTTFQSMGFFPKLLIAPGYSQDETTASALTTLATTIRAMAFIDSPPATSVASAISNRGTAGNSFDTSSYRAILCFPQEMWFDPSIVPTGNTLNNQGIVINQLYNANADAPYSQWVAGVTAAQDIANGYWFSPSNVQVQGIVGPDIPMYSSAFDPSSDTNNLNAAGILTVFNGFGTGLRVWGNTSAAYPSFTDPATFIPIRRTMDVVEQSVQLAMMQFLDQPITNGLINSILATVNGFLRTLVQRGALIGGVCTYNPAENTAVQLAAGQLTFDISLMPPPPAQTINFNVYVNIALLNTLGPVSAAQTQPTGAQ